MFNQITPPNPPKPFPKTYLEHEEEKSPKNGFYHLTLLKNTFKNMKTYKNISKPIKPPPKNALSPEKPPVWLLVIHRAAADVPRPRATSPSRSRRSPGDLGRTSGDVTRSSGFLEVLGGFWRFLEAFWRLFGGKKGC